MLELKKNNLGVDDLIESMRSSGYFSLDDLYYAIYESNGKLSGLENTNRPTENSSLPVLLIDDGRIIKHNANLIKSTEEGVINFLKQNNAKVKDVEVLTVDGNGRAYFKKKKEKFTICNFSLEEGVKW